MLLVSSPKEFYNELNTQTHLSGEPEFDSRGIWYEDTILGVALRLDYNGSMYVDG